MSNNQINNSHPNPNQKRRVKLKVKLNPKPSPSPSPKQRQNRNQKRKRKQRVSQKPRPNPNQRKVKVVIAKRMTIPIMKVLVIRTTMMMQVSLITMMKRNKRKGNHPVKKGQRERPIPIKRRPTMMAK
jgi:hypothetical protein